MTPEQSICDFVKERLNVFFHDYVLATCETWLGYISAGYSGACQQLGALELGNSWCTGAWQRVGALVRGNGWCSPGSELYQLYNVSSCTYDDIYYLTAGLR